VPSLAAANDPGLHENAIHCPAEHISAIPSTPLRATYTKFLIKMCLLERRWQMNLLQRLLVGLMLKVFGR